MGLYSPWLQIIIRLRNGFKFNPYRAQGKFNRQQFDDFFFFFFFSENKIWHFMQTVSLEDNLHEISNIVIWNNLEKYFKMSSADFFSLTV